MWVRKVSRQHPQTGTDKVCRTIRRQFLIYAKASKGVKMQIKLDCFSPHPSGLLRNYLKYSNMYEKKKTHTQALTFILTGSWAVLWGRSTTQCFLPECLPAQTLKNTKPQRQTGRAKEPSCLEMWRHSWTQPKTQHYLDTPKDAPPLYPTCFCHGKRGRTANVQKWGVCMVDGGDCWLVAGQINCRTLYFKVIAKQTLFFNPVINSVSNHLNIWSWADALRWRLSGDVDGLRAPAGGRQPVIKQ